MTPTAGQAPNGPDDPAALPTSGIGSVDYVLRTAQQEMIAISTLADQKANILLGVSLIMTTVVVGVLPNTGMTYALGLLGGASALAATLALLSLLPSRVKDSKQPNPLYFADVAAMTYVEYHATMAATVSDSQQLYGAVLHDLYQSSQFLVSRKFRYLRAAYTVFLIGIGLTLIGVLVDVAVGNI